MQSKKILSILTIILGLFLVAGFILFGGEIFAQRASEGGNYGPPTRLPLPGTGGVDTDNDLDDLQVISGHGSDQAEKALQPVISSLPFNPRLPSYLPTGLKIINVAGNLNGGEKDSASFDAYYVKDTENGRMEFHTFQTNERIDKNASPALQTHWKDVKTVSIGSETWDYHLLVYPQPDGSELKLHELDRTFSDGIYVEIDIRARGDADTDELMQELIKIAESMQN